MFKVIYIDQVIHSPHTPSHLKDGNNYFTYGWAGKCARKFKEFNTDIKVECWKVDTNINKIYKREISGVIFKMIPGFSVKYLGISSITLLKNIKKEIASDHKIIFNMSSIRHLLFYSVALCLKNNPFVVQHHGEASALYKSSINKGFKHLFFLFQKPFEKTAFKNVDLFYYIDEQLLKYLPIDPVKTKLKLQTVGVESEKFPVIERNKSRELLNLDIDKKYILHIGRLDYAKGVDILIEIYKELRKERDDIELILGGTSEKDPLYKVAKESGAIIYGKILHTEIFKFLAAADVYVLPKYLNNDPFGGIGLLPIESLLCNTPVVGASLQNFPQEHRDSVGFAVSDYHRIKQSILQITDQKTVFNNLRKTALSYYSWENIIKNTTSDYTQIRNAYANK